MTYHLDDLLVRDSLELARSINKPFPDVVCKLEGSNKVAYTAAKAHRDIEHSIVIAAQEEKLAKKSTHPGSNILSP